MNEQINTYILRKKKEQKSIIDQMLVSEGIYKKVPYEPSCDAKLEFEVKTQQYFHKKPIKLTDEEYEQIKVICEETEQLRRNCQTEKIVQYKNSAIATALKVVAVLIFIVGFIIGLVLCDATNWNDPTVVIVSWVMSLISGLLFLASAKIIDLLNEIKHRL